MISYDFINYSAFVDIKQTLGYELEVYFLCIVPYVFFTFLRWIKFCSCFRQIFFHLGVKKKLVPGYVRQVVVLYSNNWTGICLGRFSIGRLTEVVI